MNAQQLFFALMEDERTPPIFVSDHKTDPISDGLKWFIKDLHDAEGVEQEYDFEEVQQNIIDGFINDSIVMHQISRITDKYFRDGNH